MGERENFVNATPLHSALRQLRTSYTDRRALATMGLVGVVLGLVGPFNTFALLNEGLRILYWLTVVFLTFGAGLFGGNLLSGWLVPSRRPLWLHVPVMALGASVPVAITVQLINLAFFADPMFQGWRSLALLFYCFVIALGLGAVLDGIIAPLLAPRPDPVAQSRAALILERLPHHLRAPLTHMSMADHYVEIFTTKGSAMVLLRLADAIRETEGIAGMQVHRSHWVARDAVAALVRDNGKPVLVLKSGARLPVSRSFLAPVKASLDLR